MQTLSARERTSEGAREQWRDHRHDDAGVRRAPLSPSLFPKDAAAIIFQPAPPVTTSKRPKARPWTLAFLPQTPPFIEPLMGWTGSADTLPQVQLTFPSAAAAMRYAERNNIRLAA